MLAIRRRTVLAAAIALIAFVGPLSLTPSSLVATDSLPAELSDQAFEVGPHRRRREACDVLNEECVWPELVKHS